MRDDDMELSPAELSELRLRLDEAAIKATSELVASREAARPVDLGLPIGRLTRVDAVQQQHLAMARTRRAETLLQTIEAAKVRLTNGSYGWCVKCGEAIGHGRLAARPESPTCRDCMADPGK